MKKYLIISIILLFSITDVLTQRKKDFSLEFNVNGSHHGMKSASQYIENDPLYKWDYISLDKDGSSSIKFGLDYYLGISYQPLDFMDFGVYLNYQSASLKHSNAHKYFPDPWNYPDSSYTRYGKIKKETKAFTLGLTTNLYLNKIFHFEDMKSSFLKKAILSVGVKGGIGWSMLDDWFAIVNDNYEFRSLQYKSTNFNGRTELALGYPLFDKSFFSQVGIKVGYQFFKTSPLKNDGKAYLHPNNMPGTNVSLDFSGVYYGVYFKIGKH